MRAFTRARAVADAHEGRRRHRAVNPANIKRVVRELPPGYEVTTGIPSGASPRVIWSLEADASDSKAKPPQCATLADPGNGRDQSAQGVSGSGSGGIVDAVVVALPGPVELARRRRRRDVASGP